MSKFGEFPGRSGEPDSHPPTRTGRTALRRDRGHTGIAQFRISPSAGCKLSWTATLFRPAPDDRAQDGSTAALVGAWSSMRVCSRRSSALTGASAVTVNAATTTWADRRPRRGAPQARKAQRAEMERMREHTVRDYEHAGSRRRRSLHARDRAIAPRNVDGSGYGRASRPDRHSSRPLLCGHRFVRCHDETTVPYR